MTALLAALVYAYGFAFFLGYARGHDSSMPSALWAHAFALAAIWPLAVIWFAVRRADGTSPRFIALAFLLLAAASARATFTLTLSTAGPVTPLAIVTSTPSGIVCPGTCSAAFAAGSTVTLGYYVPSTMTFSGWSGDNGCKTNSQSCAVLMDAAKAVTANFNPLLDLSFSGIGLGIVTSTGIVTYTTSTAIGTARGYVYPKGSSIVLTASTGPYSAFVGWSGDSGCSRASTCTFTLNGYESIVATFTASAATYPLQIDIPLGGGAVTSSPTGIYCPGVCRSTFTAGATVTFTTAASSGYRFAGWANGGCSGINVCVVHSTSPLQGLGGRYSPGAFFYQVTP